MNKLRKAAASIKSAGKKAAGKAAGVVKKVCAVVPCPHPPFLASYELHHRLRAASGALDPIHCRHLNPIPTLVAELSTCLAGIGCGGSRHPR